jgi:hypothetical protein
MAHAIRLLRRAPAQAGAHALGRLPGKGPVIMGPRLRGDARLGTDLACGGIPASNSSWRAQRSNPELQATARWQPFWIAAALRASQ